MNNQARIKEMQRRLTAALQPTALDIEDQSHLHAGHAGAEEGKGHFVVSIASAAFAGHTPIKRHRLVYEALGDLLESDISAVTIIDATP